MEIFLQVLVQKWAILVKQIRSKFKSQNVFIWMSFCWLTDGQGDDMWDINMAEGRPTNNNLSFSRSTSIECLAWLQATTNYHNSKAFHDVFFSFSPSDWNDFLWISNHNLRQSLNHEFFLRNQLKVCFQQCSVSQKHLFVRKYFIFSSS